MTGIQEITWTGFANQTFTLKPAINSGLTLPPIKVSEIGKTVFYSDTIRVETKYIPKPGPIASLVNHWIVRRQIMEGFDPGKPPKSPTIVDTTDIAINNQGLAISKPGSLAINLGAKEGRWLRYQLGHVTLVIVAGGPGKPPKTKQMIKLLDDYFEVIPLPELGQPAYTVNMYRPLPCEFETVKFEILGKTKENGKEKVLQTIKGGEFPPVKVPTSEAKKQQGPPDNLQLTYAACWTLKRINPPNFIPTQGYVVQMGRVSNVFIAELVPVLSGLTMPVAIGSEISLTFDIHHAVNSGDTTRELCLGNALTNSKFTGQVFASVQAETNLQLNW